MAIGHTWLGRLMAHEPDVTCKRRKPLHVLGAADICWTYVSTCKVG